MSFLKAFLTGYGDMVQASSDIDRMKYLPQRIEDGEFINFKGKSMFGVVENAPADMVILDADRVNEATRYTAALKRDYFVGFNKLIAELGGDAPVEDETEDQEEDAITALYNRLYKVVAAGDKKGFRAIRKDLKDQWFALDDADVEDAIFDLSDAVADKDVDLAKEIVEGLGEDGTETEAPAVKDIAETTPKVKKAAPKKTAKLTEEESEIIEDLKSAIDDGDQKDIDELLAELKEVNEALYDEWLPATQVEQPKEDEGKPGKEEDDNVVDEIIEDLDAAIADEDEEEAKACLEELADEVGVESDVYKVNAEKLAPKKTRRSRRGK